MFKKHMTPLSKGGQTVAHKGKGSQMAGMPDRKQITGMGSPGATMNDYAKASPAPQPAPPMPGPASGSYGTGG